MTQTSTTIEIAAGSVVEVRDEEWLVTSAEQTSDGLLVHVQGMSELVRDTTASFYASLDEIVPLDPREATVVADGSPHYRRSRLWLESTYRKTPIPLNHPGLTVSTQGLADQLSYQQAAVRRALDPANLRPRILLADSVGLGKTLEIGMILAELVRRGRGDRILIVTPKHVLEQMQHEMWTRFALPFVRLDSQGIQRVRQKLPATRNPFTYYKRVIISIDTLKSDRYAAALRKQRWDAVVIDESHNLSSSASLNNRLARILATTTEALILASATPHNGRKDSFAELVRLLDPAAVSPSGDLEAEQLKRLVIRRHRYSDEVKSVVGADWAERPEPKNITITPSKAEDRVADELADLWLFPTNGSAPVTSGSHLFPWTLAKAFLSSPAALQETIANRRKTLADRDDSEKELAALDDLDVLNDACFDSSSAKYTRLVEYLKSVGVGKGSTTRAVVFAERLRTISWLADHLAKDVGLPLDAIAVMHGGLSDEEQQRIVDQFKQSHTAVRILVTGDVASEGVNLHSQCHNLIHYDVPWSLIRIEQRNGRIDRYGQRTPPQIATLLLDPSSERFSGDIRVLTRLMEKEHEAHSALGDVASLMGQYSESKEEDEIRKVLAGQKHLDEVVKSVEEVFAGSDMTALFFKLTMGSPQDAPAPVAAEESSGLYPSQLDFLDEALREAYVAPGEPLAANGVGWVRNKNSYDIAILTPPADLAARLEVLPKAYLDERKVKRQLTLATTKPRGQQSLKDALSDSSDSSWPEAHFLSPLHPVLDWAADRALSSLGRNQVFAIRGPVDGPSVLLLGTLTNRHGQVVAASWMTATFPSLDTRFCTIDVHASLHDATADLGISGKTNNPGGVQDPTPLNSLIAPAVDQARAQMKMTFRAAAEDVSSRVTKWGQRLADWDADANALIQRSELRALRTGIKREQELVNAMKPDRQLVRPLLIVVPEATP